MISNSLPFRSVNLQIPLVVRLEGTNVDEAKKILADSGLPIKRL